MDSESIQTVHTTPIAPTESPMDAPQLPPAPPTPKKPSTVSPAVVVGLLVGTLVMTGVLLFGLNKILDKGSSSSGTKLSGGVIAQASPTDAPVNTPQPTDTPTPTPSPTPTPTPTPSPTPVPTPTPAPTPSTTVTLTNVAGQDGYMGSDGNGAPDQDIRVGRTQTSTIRGFIGFDLASIPKSAHIISAKLRVYQHSITGDPYGVDNGSQVVVDHLDYGSTISSSSYGASTFASNVGTLSSGSQIEWKQLDVTARVAYDLSTHTSSQFRLRLTNESQGGPAGGDYASFDSNSSGFNTNPPQLVVAYY